MANLVIILVARITSPIHARVVVEYARKGGFMIIRWRGSEAFAVEFDLTIADHKRKYEVYKNKLMPLVNSGFLDLWFFKDKEDMDASGFDILEVVDADEVHD
jgi:hypothetical protein